ncbi:MAG: amidohydrolase family protein [Armatimonadota bacterium]|nr:MAG: amidohydrolase family protein [Armatimonadota bacterium]
MPIIDVHAHYGPWFWPVRAQTVDEIRAGMKRFAIERVFLASTVAITGEIESGNAQVAEVIEGSDDLFGWCVINPNFVDLSLEQIQTYLRRRDFIGAKMHAAYHMQPMDSPLTAQLVKALLRYDKPLMVQVRSEGELARLDALAEQFPSAHIIIGNMAGAHWQPAARLADKRVNIVIECGGRVADRDKIAYAMEKAGPHRVVFGTDQPLVHPAFAVGAVRDAQLESSQKDAVLQGNARRLFKL